MQALLKNNVDTYNLQFSQQSTIAFSLGIIWAQPDSATTMEDLLSQADKAMYEHKRLRKSTT
jgi:predicted signal transduction protein with EAL and GGDEF domain